MNTLDIIRKTAETRRELALCSNEKKNKALMLMAAKLVEHRREILEANREDVESARGHIKPSMIDRLSLDEKRLKAMADGIGAVAKLNNPVGRIIDTYILPNGIKINKVSVPFGTIGVIYEARPNVTSDVASLCIKSGNAVVLRSGKDAYRSSKAIVIALKEALKEAGISENAVNILDDVSRESANILMSAKGFVDLLIPRGGKGLIDSCVNNATVPIIETGTGICHVYVDEAADLQKALDIVNNAKTSRPSVCNAEEVLLVNENIAESFLPLLKKKLVDERRDKGLNPVELRLDSNAIKIIEGNPAQENDFDTEFLDYILAIKIVGSIKEAIEHIDSHSTKHSDCIVTENAENAELFLNSIDSAAVYHNASTRFTDGGEFGLGCEIGISTQKLHARGPMGLVELNTYKYKIYGNGQVR